MTSIFQVSFRWAPKALAGLWCALAIFLSWLGTLPDGYLIHVRGITTPQPYPFQQIGSEILVVAVVLAVLAWALIGTSWKRVGKILICAVLAGTTGVLAGLGSMHAPSHFVHFAFFMLMVAAISLIAAISLSIMGFVQAAR